MSKAGRTILIRILGGKCEKCGSTNGLSIHHINGDHNCDDIKNLQLLCRKCHGRAHRFKRYSIRSRKNLAVSDEGIIEYLSRPARREIVKELCQELLQEKNESYDMKLVRRRGGRPHHNGVTLLASALGISRNSVNRWMNCTMQSSNSNAHKILELAKVIIPEKIEIILLKDVARHRELIQQYCSASTRFEHFTYVSNF